MTSSPSTCAHVNPRDVTRHIEALGYSHLKALQLTDMITREEMAREPSQSAHITNTLVSLPSAKMGVTIIAESFGIEYARVLQLEMDPNVLYYAAQPGQMQGSWTDSGGKVRRETFNPDFLIVTQDDLWFEETKPEAHIEKKLKKQGQKNWSKDDEGKYRYLPGDHNELGVPFHVVTDRSLGRTAIRNREFLISGHVKRERSETGTLCASAALDRILAVFRINRARTISELASDAEVEPIEIYRAIGDGELLFLIDDELLAEPERCHVFREPEFMRAAKHSRHLRHQVRIRVGMELPIDSESYRVMAVEGEFLTILVDGNLEHIKISSLDLDALAEIAEPPPIEACLADRTDTMLHEAMERMRVLAIYEAQGIIETNPLTGGPYSKRTLNRWIRQRSLGRAAGVCDLDAVMPNRIGQGRRSEKDDPNPLLPDEVTKLMDEFLRASYLAPFGSSLANTLRKLNTEIHERWPNQGREVCYSTLRNRLHKGYPYAEVQRKRKGSRCGKAAMPAYGCVSGEAPMQGDYSFHVVEVDHTQVDQTAVARPEGGSCAPLSHYGVEVVDDIGMPINGRLVLSCVNDSYSRFPLAWHFTLDLMNGKGKGKGDKTSRPSGARMSLLLKKMLMRHHRFPTRLHVDGGSDFQSHALDRVLASNGCIKSRRPPGDPKKGPLIERFFKTLNDDLWHQQPGSRKFNAPQYQRRVTQAHKGESHAQFTLAELNEMLDFYMECVYPNKEHTGIMTTPRAKFSEGLARQPEYVQVIHSEERIDELLAIEAGEGEITQDGIRYRGDYFSSPEIANNYAYIGKRVLIRYLPFDDSVLYASIDGRTFKLNSNLRKARQRLYTLEERIEATQARDISRSASRSRQYQQNKRPLTVPNEHHPHTPEASGRNELSRPQSVNSRDRVPGQSATEQAIQWLKKSPEVKNP